MSLEWIKTARYSNGALEHFGTPCHETIADGYWRCRRCRKPVDYAQDETDRCPRCERCEVCDEPLCYGDGERRCIDHENTDKDSYLRSLKG